MQLHTKDIQLKLKKENEFSHLVAVLDVIIDDLKDKHELDDKELLHLIKKRIDSKKESYIPVTVFEDRSLGALESVVKYAKEDLGLSYHQIAVLLKRDDRTIWTSYNSSLKKRKEPFSIKQSKYNVPISLLCDRNIGILESVVLYLKDELNFRYRSIAELLNRNERTIWTTYKRAKQKHDR